MGTTATEITAALFLLAFYRGRVPEDKAEVKSLGKAAILLEPEELPDLIGILQEDGRLRAGDGFGLDITENVTCKRTWLSGEDYTILFRVYNGYGDTAEATVSAVISGEVEHPELELSAISVTIPVGEAFDPYSYILSARDSDGTDRQGDVQVGTVPDTSVPGTYQVAYTLTSSDGMEQVTKYLTVAMPHCSMSRLREEPGLARRIRQMTKEINERLEEDRISLQLLAGMEIMAEETRVEELAGALREESLLTLNGTRYPLVEFPFRCSPSLVYRTVEHLRENGFVPVIAHPERYRCVVQHPQHVYDWYRMGAVIQVNKGSVLGRFGRSIQRTADLLLRHRLAAAVASDAHRPGMRTPDMTWLRERLAERYGAYCPRLLLDENPERIVRNREVIWEEPMEIEE